MQLKAATSNDKGKTTIHFDSTMQQLSVLNIQGIEKQESMT